MTILKQTLLGTALLAVMAVPAFAAEGKKTKEITEKVGYNVTETQVFVGPYAKAFDKMDTNKDGIVNFKEYQRASNVDNEYEMFALIDKDQSKGITVEELVNANVTKGSTQVASEMFGMVKGTNLRTKKLPEVRTYYEPIEPVIVDVKQIEPAAQ